MTVALNTNELSVHLKMAKTVNLTLSAFDHNQLKKKALGYKRSELSVTGQKHGIPTEPDQLRLRATHWASTFPVLALGQSAVSLRCLFNPTHWEFINDKNKATASQTI